MLHFHNCLAFDCIGHNGGVAVLRNNNMNCSILSYSNNHIDLNVFDLDGDWHIIRFYGFPERRRHHLSWNLLRQLAHVNHNPWVCIGDFNDLLNPLDKKCRVPYPPWLFRGFRDAIMDCNLSDVLLLGYLFTWSRGREGENAVEDRLDRDMGNWIGIPGSQKPPSIIW